MYLPKPYKNFSDKFPEIVATYKEMGKACRRGGPLPDKYQNLIKLGIAAGANSRGAVMSSVRKALASEATAEEINQAILLSLTTIGFPNMIAALGWAETVLEKQKK